MTKKLLLLTILFFSQWASAQFSEKSKDYKKYGGLFNFLYDAKNDKVYLEVTDLNKEFLYVYSLSSGIGSNDLGLGDNLEMNKLCFLKKQAKNYCWYSRISNFGR